MTNLDSCYWVYQYDSLGQVTSGVKYWSDGTPVAGQQFGYVFDSIGNRQTTATGGDQAASNLRGASYSANNLNQYTGRTIPAASDVIGSATNTATVTVNGQSTYRHEDYYRTELAIDNSSGPVFQSVSNVAVPILDTNIISTNIVGNVFLPQSPEAFTYDADGNLTSDGRWTYVWDAENRLIGMTNNANVPDAAKMTLGFKFDYIGRRIEKAVGKYNPSTLSYQTALQNTFLYDGWNLQAELNGTNNALVRSYVWGLDLSGALQGAGGVGGLLWTYQPDLGNTSAFACFDGNGNVSTLVYCPDGSVVGQYEYGPFGEVLRTTGPMARANPLRFSTKYEDAETGFDYYGKRHYDADIGRWSLREPLEEIASQNLYGFVRNDSVMLFDVLGLYAEDGHFYTTYMVALAAAYSRNEAYRLAYFSQLPDQLRDYSAWDGSKQDFAEDYATHHAWLQEIQELLHSLHGGDPIPRRKCLLNLLKDRNLQDWEKGLIIHALGDSYAHTHSSDGKNWEAYNFPLGHALTTDHGHEPDIIAHRPELYGDYVRILFQGLQINGKSDYDKLTPLFEKIDSKDFSDDPHEASVDFRNFAQTVYGYANGYYPEMGDYLHNRPVGANDLGTLCHTQVQNLMNKIRTACCSSGVLGQ